MIALQGLKVLDGLIGKKAAQARCLCGISNRMVEIYRAKDLP